MRLKTVLEEVQKRIDERVKESEGSCKEDVEEGLAGSTDLRKRVKRLQR